MDTSFAGVPLSVSAGAPSVRDSGIAFGPMSSRRFGLTLGVSNIAPKVCTYSCVYCPLGQTARMSVEPRPFLGSEAVARAVRFRLDDLRREGERVDHLTFMACGEPTLDVALSPAIRLLRSMGLPVAVMTNGALLTRPGVRAALCEADRVSLKVDAVRENAWRRVNRPHLRLDLESVLDGMHAFARSYEGVLTTETVLVDGLNDGEEEVSATAAFIGSLHPSLAYLSVPGPPAGPARPATEESLARAWEIFQEQVSRVELSVGYEGSTVASTGDAAQDLLSITAVRPMSDRAVAAMLQHARLRWGVVDRLVEDGKLVEVHRGARRYFLRPTARS